MKKIIFILLGIGLLFAGCDLNDEFYPNAESNEMLKSTKVKMVPFKGDLQSNVTEYLDGVPVSGTLSGKLSHLGLLNTEKSVWKTVNLTFDETTWTITWEMSGVVCAANGDFLNYILVGTFSIPDNKLTAHADCNGGTGRFKDAEGYLEITGYADNPAAISVMYMSAEGMISSVGSKK